MAEEEEVLVVAASPKPSSDHKRKLDEFEPQEELILEQPPKTSGQIQVSNADPDAADEVADVSPDESDAKRPRLDDTSGDIGTLFSSRFRFLGFLLLVACFICFCVFRICIREV